LYLKLKIKSQDLIFGVLLRKLL